MPSYGSMSPSRMFLIWSLMLLLAPPVVELAVVVAVLVVVAVIPTVPPETLEPSTTSA